jgi:hypothetical protein
MNPDGGKGEPGSFSLSCGLAWRKSTADKKGNIYT